MLLDPFLALGLGFEADLYFSKPGLLQIFTLAYIGRDMAQKG